MKKIAFFIIFISIIFANSGCEKEESSALTSSNKKTLISKSSNYGIYGEVLWPVSGTPYNIIQSPTVYIYKYVNDSWLLQGTTVASMCGYYTYETSGTGLYKAVINGYYNLRNYPNCNTIVSYGLHAGSGQDNVTILTPWKLINVRCS